MICGIQWRRLEDDFRTLIASGFEFPEVAPLLINQNGAAPVNPSAELAEGSRVASRVNVRQKRLPGSESESRSISGGQQPVDSVATQTLAPSRRRNKAQDPASEPAQDIDLHPSQGSGCGSDAPSYIPRRWSRTDLANHRRRSRPTLLPFHGVSWDC